MKSSVMPSPAALVRSLPTRGAWIEILYHIGAYNVDTSLPTRGAWIEIAVGGDYVGNGATSLPTRGAWIEISPFSGLSVGINVAPHTGSVD